MFIPGGGGAKTDRDAGVERETDRDEGVETVDGGVTRETVDAEGTRGSRIALLCDAIGRLICGVTGRFTSLPYVVSAQYSQKDMIYLGLWLWKCREWASIPITGLLNIS
jgi:hypothetical protein